MVRHVLQSSNNIMAAVLIDIVYRETVDSVDHSMHGQLF